MKNERFPKIKYLWMFITEKCNLACDYCFYKFRDRRTTIPFKVLKNIIDFVRNKPMPEFVISGGEPLLEWNLVKKTVNYIKKIFENPCILIQTNGIPLDKEKIAFIKKNNVKLEFGIDGDFLSNARHRIDTTKENYERIVRNIKNSIAKGVPVSSTLTVHPENAGNLYHNYMHLLSLGIPRIEITPAAFERWEDKEVRMFKAEYLKVLKHEISSGNLNNISMEYDLPLNGFYIDLIVMADGKVLPNWSLLSLPKDVKNLYVFLEVNKNGIKENNEVLRKLLRYYKTLFSQKNVTYRDFSTFNCEFVYREFSKIRKDLNPEGYYELNRFLKKINQPLMIYNQFSSLKKIYKTKKHSKNMINEHIKIKEGYAVISINPEIYSLPIIYSAAYVFLDKAYIVLDKENGKITAYLKPKENEDIRKLAMDFYNELLNYAHYSQRVKENHEITKMIIQRALFSTDSTITQDIEEKEIEELLKELEKEEDEDVKEIIKEIEDENKKGE